MIRVNRYEYPSLVTCAEALHEHVTGSSDPLCDEEETKVLGFLNMRLREWQKTLHSEALAYDEAVRNLVRAAIDEYMQSHWNRGRRVFPAPPFVCDCGHNHFFIYTSINGTHYHCTHCGRDHSSTSASETP